MLLGLSFWRLCKLAPSRFLAIIFLATCPASRGWAPYNRIWNNTTLRSPKQQIWLRTALCGGWCRHMALRSRELHARNDDDDIGIWASVSLHTNCAYWQVPVNTVLDSWLLSAWLIRSKLSLTAQNCCSHSYITPHLKEQPWFSGEGDRIHSGLATMSPIRVNGDVRNGNWLQLPQEKSQFARACVQNLE